MIKLLGILKQIIIFLICLLSSWAICYFAIDDVFVYISQSQKGFIAIRLFLAIIFYVLISSILNKSISNVQLKIFFSFYCLLILSLTFFKSIGLNEHRTNLNPLQIIEYMNPMSHFEGFIFIIGNTFIYTPIGIYLKSIFNKKSDKFFILSFLFYIIAIETIQYIFKLGIFDIDDIILNTLGFYLGLILYKLWQKLKTVNVQAF